MKNISNQELETLKNAYQKKKEEKDKKIINLCSNDDYLIWLKRFTLVHTDFRSDDQSLHTYKVSNQDRENIDRLELLYEGIEDYAEKTGIFPRLTSYGNYYPLYYKRASYYIERRITNIKTAYGCTRVSNQRLVEPIDFSDLKKYNQQKLSPSITYQKRKK